MVPTAASMGLGVAPATAPMLVAPGWGSQRAGRTAPPSSSRSPNPDRRHPHKPRVARGSGWGRRTTPPPAAPTNRDTRSERHRETEVDSVAKNRFVPDRRRLVDKA